MYSFNNKSSMDIPSPVILSDSFSRLLNLADRVRPVGNEVSTIVETPLEWSTRVHRCAKCGSIVSKMSDIVDVEKGIGCKTCAGGFLYD